MLFGLRVERLDLLVRDKRLCGPTHVERLPKRTIGVRNSLFFSFLNIGMMIPYFYHKRNTNVADNRFGPNSGMTVSIPEVLTPFCSSVQHNNCRLPTSWLAPYSTYQNQRCPSCLLGSGLTRISPSIQTSLAESLEVSFRTSRWMYQCPYNGQPLATIAYFSSMPML
jgi:hypothetical protein